MEQVNRRQVGSVYEERTAVWLQDEGWRILERNYRCRSGEIDLIARKEDILSFVEVKYRNGFGHGCSREAVDWRKQQRIIRVSRWYLASHPWAERLVCRYDVAAWENGRLQYLEGAFGGL